MALEIVNKPTVSYRTKGFCFYISNAWELLLKAFIIDKRQDINSIIIEPSKNKRSLTLSDCINRVFSSPENTIRNNLMSVLTIRNTATHLIVPALDYDLAPLFQKTVSDYYDFITAKFHYKAIPNMRPFISLNYSNSLCEDNSLKLFPNIDNVLTNLRFHDDTVEMKYTLSLTKHGHTDFTATLVKDSDTKAQFIEKPTDAERTHPYTHKEVIKRVKSSIDINGVDSSAFTSYSFQTAIKLLKLKDNKKYIIITIIVVMTIILIRKILSDCC